MNSFSRKDSLTQAAANTLDRTRNMGLKEYLEENLTRSSPQVFNGGAFYIEKPENVERINAFIKQFLGGNHLEALDVFAGCGIYGGDGGHGGFSFVSVYRLKERAPPNVPSVIGRTASPTVPHPPSSFPRRRESSPARRVIAVSPMTAAMPATSRRTLSRTILFSR